MSILSRLRRRLTCVHEFVTVTRDVVEPGAGDWRRLGHYTERVCVLCLATKDRTATEWGEWREWHPFADLENKGSPIAE